MSTRTFLIHGPCSLTHPVRSPTSSTRATPPLPLSQPIKTENSRHFEPSRPEKLPGPLLSFPRSPRHPHHQPSGICSTERCTQTLRPDLSVGTRNPALPRFLRTPCHCIIIIELR